AEAMTPKRVRGSFASWWQPTGTGHAWAESYLRSGKQRVRRTWPSYERSVDEPSGVPVLLPGLPSCQLLALQGLGSPLLPVPRLELACPFSFWLDAFAVCFPRQWASRTVFGHPTSGGLIIQKIEAQNANVDGSPFSIVQGPTKSLSHT